MVLAMAMHVRSMDVVGRSAFKQRFETMASTYVITSDIELNETLVFDSETGKVILKGSPPQNNMSYSVIFGSRETNVRPIVVQDVDLQLSKALEKDFIPTVHLVLCVSHARVNCKVLNHTVLLLHT